MFEKMDVRPIPTATFLGAPFIFVNSIACQSLLRNRKQNQPLTLLGENRGVRGVIRCVLVALAETLGLLAQPFIFIATVWGLSFHLWHFQPAGSTSGLDFAQILSVNLSSPLWWLTIIVTGIALPLSVELTSIIYRRQLLNMSIRHASSEIGGTIGSVKKTVKNSVSPLTDDEKLTSASQELGKDSEEAVKKKQPQPTQKSLSDLIEGSLASTPVQFDEASFFLETIAGHVIRNSARYLPENHEKPKAAAKKLLHPSSQDPLMDPYMPGLVSEITSRKFFLATYDSFGRTYFASTLQMLSVMLMMLQPGTISFWFVLHKKKKSETGS
jgi:hypothetical protein